MLKTFIISSALAIFAFAQDANAQISQAKPVVMKLSKLAEVKTLGDLVVYRNANFDKTVCEITDFIVYVERTGLDPAEFEVSGDNAKLTKILKSAKKGDRLSFVQVKGLCKGDAAKRQLPDAVIEVK